MTIRITALWPDGTIIVGESWHDLEDRLRGQQWNKYNVNQFRREMRRRAELWAGVTIPVKTPEKMFRALESAGMVRLSIEGDLTDA